MHVAINRKRAASTPDPPDDASLSSFGDGLKRTKTDSELDDLEIIPSSEAWSIDLDAILSSPTMSTVAHGSLQRFDNAANFKPGDSIFLLCVQGNYELHYDLLW